MDYPKSVPGVGLVAGKFADEDVASGVTGSLIPSSWGNAVTDELLNFVRSAGLDPAEADTEQLRKAADIRAASGLVVFAQPGVHTWPVPDVLRLGIKPAFICVRGGHGPGGWARSSATHHAAAGGGGEGGYAEKLVSLKGLVSVVVTVGKGGTPPVYPSGSATNGGSTSFGVFLSATGGASGAACEAGTTSAAVASGGTGGTGVGGDLNLRGAGGHAGVAGSPSVAGVSVTGGFGGGTNQGGIGGGTTVLNAVAAGSLGADGWVRIAY